MPSTTYISPVLGEGSRASLPQPPRVVHFVAPSSFLDHDDVLTVPTKSTGDTMTGAPLVVKVPRVSPAPAAVTERFTLLQKWDGVVLDADAETFTARLLDSHGELPPQQATFSRDELSPEEEAQIAMGATFVWTIGYRHIGATRHRDSTIYFRRLPPWSEDEIKAGRVRAEKVSTAIGWK
jgi:hypothetical protein